MPETGKSSSKNGRQWGPQVAEIPVTLTRNVKALPGDRKDNRGQSEGMSKAELLTSRRLPVPHGFSTRLGGVSEGPYASLNLGPAVGDLPERVAENHRRLLAAAGLAEGSLGTVTQVHGDRVWEIKSAPDPSLAGVEGDALWTSTPGAAVGVRTADCVPVLLVDPVGKRVAAIHSGWKGTELEISARAVEALVRQGTRASDLLAAIGPSIRGCCYQVSAAVADRFRGRFDGAVRDAGGTPHLDLAVAVRATLETAGLTSAHIDLLPECTSCASTQFFSHRRDRSLSGRQLSFVVCAF